MIETSTVNGCSIYYRLIYSLFFYLKESATLMIYVIFNAISKLFIFALVCGIIYFMLYTILKAGLRLVNEELNKKDEIYILIISGIITITQFTFHDIY